MSGPSRSALITGCSTGIGRATALRLAGRGYRVFAAVRREPDADALRAASGAAIEAVIVDLTDHASIEAAAARVSERVGPDGLTALVNNAGVAYSGPLEFVPLDEFRRQLEVNLVGQLAMTRAVLPSLRRAERPRLINITSIGGLVATPFYGPYCASKFALEALSDCLRIELRPWGIETVAIEPGSIATEIWSSGLSTFERTRERMDPAATELYAGPLASIERISRQTGARGISPERVARTIERAITARRPRARYLVGRDAIGMALAKRLLGARTFDHLVARALELP